MPRAATFLTEAFGRYRPGDEQEQVEDRLTEVLACVLAGDEQLGRALASEADVRVPQGGAHQVRTQEPCPSGRLDLVLQFFDSRGREAALVWFENKVDADFAEGQPGKYADDLEARGAPDPRRVAVIRRKPQLFDREIASLTWAQVARVTDRLSAQALGPRSARRLGRGWRSFARCPDAPALLRMRLELLAAIEDAVGPVPSDPLSSMDVVAFLHAETAFERLQVLLDQACQEVQSKTGFSLRGGPSRSQKNLNLGEAFYLSDPGQHAWPFEDAHVEVSAFAEPDWLDHASEPAFGAGITARSGFGLTEAQEGQLRKLLPEDATLSPAGSHPGIPTLQRCYSTMMLAEAVTKGDSLEDQAQKVGEWAATSVKTILDAFDQVGLGRARRTER